MANHLKLLVGLLIDRHPRYLVNLPRQVVVIRPVPRKRSHLALSLSDREEISRGIVAEQSLRQIATSLNRAPSIISREIQRNGGYHCYRATQADQAAWDRAHRPKLCKLACYPALTRRVAIKLKRH